MGLGSLLGLTACGTGSGSLGGDSASGGATGPRIHWVSPADGGWTNEAAAIPVIAHVSQLSAEGDGPTVAWTWEDGSPVDCLTEWRGHAATCTLSPSPPLGEHALELSVTNMDGDTTVARLSFTVAPPPFIDADADGFADAAFGGSDCNDADAQVFPGAPEVCDHRDQDCDGDADEGVSTPFYPDADGDGFGDSSAWTNDCEAPSGQIPTGGDCADDDPARQPGALERCNGLDDDCDGEVDELETDGWYADTDGDGFGDPRSPLSECVPEDGGGQDASDCDDDDATQRWCRSCADALAFDPAQPSDTETLERDDGTFYDARCKHDQGGGGWTLLGTNAWDDTWQIVDMVDARTFGTSSTETSHKSAAWASAPFTDVLFENGPMVAQYDGIGDGTTSWWAFSSTILPGNCAQLDHLAWPMTTGNLSSPGLCDLDLTLHPQALDDGACQAAPRVLAWGPTWSSGTTSQPCPPESPDSTGFLRDVDDRNPWGTATPLRMWAR
jgi:hypothetical protein